MHCLECLDPRRTITLIAAQKLPVSVRSVHFDAVPFLFRFGPRFPFNPVIRVAVEPGDGIIVIAAHVVAADAIVLLGIKPKM